MYLNDVSEVFELLVRLGTKNHSRSLKTLMTLKDP